MDTILEESSDYEQDAPRGETSMRRWPYFPLAFGSLVLSIFTSIVVMFLVERIITVPTHVYLSEHKALYESWQAQPFIELSIEDSDTGC